MYSVAVIMSTYNGSTYLEEQLESILKQEDVEVHLYIRDDGSKQDTISILQKYEYRDNIHIFYEENIGVGNSFMNAMYKIKEAYDYYSFADQDDIWDKRKLICATKKLENKKFSLYASNQLCINGDGSLLGIRYDCQHINLKPIEILSKNMLAGCTMVFPHALFEELVRKEHRPSEELLKNRIHDVWVAMVACICDGIYYDKNSYIQYRQHENNVVGAYSEGLVYGIKQKIAKLFDSKQRNGRSKLAFEVVNKFPERFSEDDLMLACAYPRKLKNKSVLLKNSKIICNGSGETLVGLCLKIIFCLF